MRSGIAGTVIDLEFYFGGRVTLLASGIYVSVDENNGHCRRGLLSAEASRCRRRLSAHGPL